MWKKMNYRLEFTNLNLENETKLWIHELETLTLEYTKKMTLNFQNKKGTLESIWSCLNLWVEMKKNIIEEKFKYLDWISYDCWVLGQPKVEKGDWIGQSFFFLWRICLWDIIHYLLVGWSLWIVDIDILFL